MYMYANTEGDLGVEGVHGSAGLSGGRPAPFGEAKYKKFENGCECYVIVISTLLHWWYF